MVFFIIHIMTFQKLLKIVLLVGAGLVLLFILVLYFTLKTKTADLKNVDPFKNLMNKEVVLVQPVSLFQEHNDVEIPNEDFPYVIVESKNSRYKWYMERADMGTISSPEATFIAKLPAGTIVQFEKAANYTNGVSGNSYPYLFGTVQFKNAKYPITYQWGEEDFSLVMNKKEKSWQFSKAPWQKVQDTNHYEIPKGSF